MAVTAALAKVTDYSFAYVLSQDGGAGTTLIIANATILADLVAAGITTDAPIRRLWSTVVAGLTTAIARARYNGDASGIASQDLSETEHSEISLTPRTLIGGYIADVDTDAVTVTLPEINVTAPAGASTCLMTVTVKHTIDR